MSRGLERRVTAAGIAIAETRGELGGEKSLCAEKGLLADVLAEGELSGEAKEVRLALGEE